MRVPSDSFVNWDNPTNLGPIPESSWACPKTGPGEIEAMAHAGIDVTDDDIIRHAGGRWQHLELLAFPSHNSDYAYHAVQVVDSETGDIVTDSASTVRYGGLTTGGFLICVGLLDGGRTLPIGGGRELDTVTGHLGKIEARIRPTKVGESEPDYYERLRTGLDITPANKRLTMKGEGRVAHGPIFRAEVYIGADSTGVLAVLALEGEGPKEDSGLLRFRLTSEGVHDLKVRRGQLLNTLGIAFDPEFVNDSWGEVSEPPQPQRALEAIAQALGTAGARSLNFPETAARLYTAMGQRNLDLGTVIAFDS